MLGHRGTELRNDLRPCLACGDDTLVTDVATTAQPVADDRVPCRSA